MRARLLWAILFIYVLVVGGLWAGFYTPSAFQNSRTLLGVLVTIWAIWRIPTSNGWRWEKSILDVPILLWGMAFILSTLANWDKVEVISIGLWWALIYILIWFILNDMISNGVSAEAMLDGLLIASIPVALVAFLQLFLHAGRVTATLENPNYAGAFFALMIPLAYLRKQWLYSFLLGGLLVATLSRGAIVGSVAAWIVLWLMRRSRLRWWQVAALCLIPLGLIVAARFGAGNDLLTGREIYWQDAIQKFAEQPLTGSGLFTYRHPDYLDPNRVHMHPHSVPLLVAAELGIPGLLALAVTMVVIGRTVWNNRNPYAVALIPVVVYALVDVALMQPAQMVCLIVVLSVCSRNYAKTID